MYDLKVIADRFGNQSAKNDIEKLQIELSDASNILAVGPTTIDYLEKLDQSKLENASKKAIDISSNMIEKTTMELSGQYVIENILKTKISGLENLYNINISNLMKKEEEKAMYGGIMIPPLLENQIDKLKRYTLQLENEIRSTTCELQNLQKK